MPTLDVKSPEAPAPLVHGTCFVPSGGYFSSGTGEPGAVVLRRKLGAFDVEIELPLTPEAGGVGAVRSGRATAPRGNVGWDIRSRGSFPLEPLVPLEIEFMLVGLVPFPAKGMWFVSDISESCVDDVELSSKLSFIASGCVWLMESPLIFCFPERPNW